jgi:hypothetical protein
MFLPASLKSDGTNQRIAVPEVVGWRSLDNVELCDRGLLKF